MQSKAPTVDAYLAEIPDDRRVIVNAIRAIVNRAAPRCRESMAYGLPSWDLGGHWIALWWQRHCLALFVSDPDLVRDLASAAGSRDFGMSCVRWPSARHVRLEGLRVLIETAAKRRASLMATTERTASATAKAAAKTKAAAKKPVAKRGVVKPAAKPAKAAAKKKHATPRAAAKKARTPLAANGRARSHRATASRNGRALGHA